MSSDAPPPALPAPPAVTSAAPLLQGNLHPAVLILRLVGGLRQALFPLLLGVVVERWFLVLAAMLFLMHLGYGLVRWLTFHYVLTEAELVMREGILNRQERRIPIDRVQDLAFESTILRRVLGIAVVRVETASGQGAEGVLDSLSRSDAEHLREVLLRLRAGPGGKGRGAGAPGALAPAGEGDATAGALAAPAPEWSVFTSEAGMLLLRGLTDLRLGAVVVAAFGAAEVADQLGLLTRLRGAGDSFFAWVAGFPWGIAALLLAAVVAAVLATSVAFSALGNLMVFHGFHLTLRDDTLLCRYGLLTTRQKTLPRARVQRVRVEQTWLRRLLGVAIARADSAGSGRGTGQEAPGGFDVVVPLAPLPRIEALLPALLPGLEAAVTPLQRASRRLVARLFLKGVLWLVLPLAVAVPLLGPWAWLGLLLLGPWWLLGRLFWHNLAWGLWPRHLFLRWGLLGRYQVLVPTAKVQAVSVQQGPLQRLLGLCDLSVFVAGGPPTRLPDLAEADAGAVLLELVERATAAAASDWPTLSV